jgi:hypothetical protein
VGDFAAVIAAEEGNLLGIQQVDSTRVVAVAAEVVADTFTVVHPSLATIVPS